MSALATSAPVAPVMTSGVAGLVTHPISVSTQTSATYGGLPTDYHDLASPICSSSLSSGGNTNDTEFRSVSPLWALEDLPELLSVHMASSDDRVSPSDWLQFSADGDHSGYELPPIPTAETASQTSLQPMVDVGCDARPLARPWLEQPRIASRVLADQMAALLTADFDAPASAVTERLVGLL